MIRKQCLIVGRKNEIKRLEFESLRVLGEEFEVMRQIKNLGVIFYSNLTLNEQVNQVVKTAGYHLRNIAFLKRYLDERMIKMLVHNYVISK